MLVPVVRMVESSPGGIGVITLTLIMVRPPVVRVAKVGERIKSFSIDTHRLECLPSEPPVVEQTEFDKI